MARAGSRGRLSLIAGSDVPGRSTSRDFSEVRVRSQPLNQMLSHACADATLQVRITAVLRGAHSYYIISLPRTKQNKRLKAKAKPVHSAPLK